MSIHIDQVLDYLDSNLVCSRAENMDSLLEAVHDAFMCHSGINRKAIQDRFCQLREILDMLPAEDRDAFFSLVCDLCMEHEQTAFSQGVVAGMMLMTEINGVP